MPRFCNIFAGGYSQCRQYNLTVTEAGVEVDRGATVGCQHGWEYDMEGYHVSLTVEQDWVICIYLL